MKIKNIQIFQENGTFLPGELYIRGKKIAASDCGGPVLDGNGAYAIPGLTDIHFHGCAGYDFCDGTPEALEKISAYELQNGITQICPAAMAFPEELLANAARAAREYADFQKAAPESSCAAGALLVGIHMEGPFLSSSKKGAQNPLCLQPPDAAMFQRLQKEAGGLFRLVTIAPELEGAIEFIRTFRGQVSLSIGHSEADYDTASRAFAAGANHVTHLYNAMTPFSHRSPGIVGAAFDAPGCQIELICDGLHVAPAMVRATLQLFGAERVILISDSMRAAGMPDGDYSLGGQKVKVKGPLASLPDGTIAGSVSNLMECMRRSVRDMGLPLGSAVKCAAVNPAKAIGIYDRFGSLEPGKEANLVLLDRELEIQSILFQGRPLS